MALANRSVKRYQLNEPGGTEDRQTATSLPSVLGQEHLTPSNDPAALQQTVDAAVEQLSTKPEISEPAPNLLPTAHTRVEAPKSVNKELKNVPDKANTPLSPLTTRLAEAIREAPVLDPGAQKELERLVSWKKATIVVVMALFVGFLLGAMVVILLL